MDAKICTNCGKELFKYAEPAKNYFCYSKCYHMWKCGENNPNWRGGGIQYTCEFCGKEFFVRRNRATSQSGRYCSKECFFGFQASVRMSREQRSLSKGAIKNLTRWLRRDTEIRIDRVYRYGYSPEDFKRHIESLWKPGMTWENYGVIWCLDHKTAMQFLDFVDIEDSDSKRCFALENLQPLFMGDNLRKGRRDESQGIYWRG